MLMGLQVIAFYPELFSIQKNLHRKIDRKDGPQVGWWASIAGASFTRR